MNPLLVVSALGFLVIAALQLKILKRLKKMSDGQTRISAQIARLTTVDAGLKTLVADLVSRIRGNSGDEAAMNQLADDLEAQVDAIVSDVKVGTDAEAETVPAAGGDSTQEAGGADSSLTGGAGNDAIQE